ncbi:VRR-NUC domain-containing protein [Halomonas eurihalina]|uniref:phosphodiesterase I n=1 Tax=Halomonas eurihalina TaxID=42566 RepID=A0A5D9DBP8_HALER|nr:VRR-NUC domain-containing protein [Halomonas eurihalina]MDR5859141.1 VRR-NUC domain-containing protein [Halomonas eurihalina]TZG41029.1 VRR-NUC domain-containing protein [Halomonas eurihalina]
MNSASSTEGVSASLDDPRYYLSNFQFVLDWVAVRHDDLLDDAERAFLESFPRLPMASRALLVRMVMRRGEVFRYSRLEYAEIGAVEAALAPLLEAGFVEDDPACDVGELFRQLRLSELRQALAGEIAAAGLSRSLGKAVLREALEARLTDPLPLTEWWPEAPDRLVRLTVMPLCDRLRLMFFGNLRQDWAEFVLAELGVQRFETVPFDVDSRAFGCREEVEDYVFLHRLRERLDEGECPLALGEHLGETPARNTWLASRRARLLVRLGREAERRGEGEVALSYYARSGDGEGRIRRLRLLERRGEHERAHALLEQAVPVGEYEAQALSRLRPRLCRRLGLAPPSPSPESRPRRFDLVLTPHAGGVELAVAEHLASPEAPVHFVENALICGLFGLLCWEVIFAPLPGAFFHPFQAGPADLGREDFVARRRGRFEACLAELDDGRYRRSILDRWHAKHGLAAVFVDWERLPLPLVELALARLPAAHLRACFERLLADPLANRSGLPDLIQFLPDAESPRYRLIEVKGPGDRLQDNQRRWLSFFQARGIPAAVCHVAWRETS